ncbi:MAG TPA: hypothetical protein VIJ18_12830 [Microbacteriaceae bacterium]
MTTLRHADFAHRVGDEFTVDWSGTMHTLVLEAVDEPHRADGIVSFGITLRGDASVPAEQGTRSFTAVGFNTTELFIVPVGRDEHGVRFHAAFSVQEG